MKCPTPSPNDSRVLELDGIRGLAIGLVLMEHYVANVIVPGMSWVGDTIKATLNVGWSGVDLFFVLSGFLIGGILLDNRASGRYFTTFYARRCCRILPPYFLLLAGVYLSMNCLSATHGSQPWFDYTFTYGKVPPFWTNATFTQNFYAYETHRFNADSLAVTWSLVVEEQFYLIFPFLVWILRPSWLIGFLISLICLNPIVQLYATIFQAHLYGIMSVLLPIRGDGLLFGVICAWLLRQPRARTWLVDNPQHLYVIFLTLLLGMGWAAPHYFDEEYFYERILFYNSWMDLFFSCLIVLAVTHRTGIIAMVMRFAPLRRLGIISYGVYLFHLPIDDLLHGLILGRDRQIREPIDIGITVLSLVVTLLFTSLLWRYLEKPIIAWGHSFRYGRSSAATPALCC